MSFDFPCKSRACWFCFKVQYSTDKVVSFIDLTKLNNFLWFAWRFLNVVSQIPLYVFCLHLPSMHFIVAWYEMLDVKHNSFIGKSSLTRQLHNFCGSVGLGCSTFLLWPFIFDLMFGMQEWLSFIVFLLTIFTKLWFGGKCLLINSMNILPTLVLTDLLYGGLNQIMLIYNNI